MPEFIRPQASLLEERLGEKRRFMQIIAGPRQVGKTTMVRQVLEGLTIPWRYSSADEPTLRGQQWIAVQWEALRLDVGKSPAVLVLDEVQKIPEWSEALKRLWDEDTRDKRRIHVVVLGSTPLLLQRGLSESLAGRFEVIRLPHWSYAEMREAFGFSYEQFVYFGGYPGSASLIDNPERWNRYINDSLIETTISRDVLLMARVDKPILLRRLFELGCRYSGQMLSFTKMLGQLHDAGNTTTLAHYLTLLEGAGLLRGLPRYAGEVVRQRASIPKLQVFNTALLTAQAGRTFQEARADNEYWGHLVESAVGAHLANAASMLQCELFYWRDRNDEVDFIVRSGRRLVAIEVKSGKTRATHSGLAAFAAAFKPDRTLLLGGDGLRLEKFLEMPVRELERAV